MTFTADMQARALTKDSQLQTTLMDGEIPVYTDQQLYFRHLMKTTENIRKKLLMRFVMIFIGSTEPFVFMYYIIPYMCEGCSPWTIYYLKVLVWFCVINMLANWFCLILVDASFAKTKDTPFINYDSSPEVLPEKFAARIQNAVIIRADENDNDSPEKEEEKILKWHYCKKCDMRAPPRAHHCKVCDKCILKRDHHCFFVETCVGFKNERYFIIMCFYIAICGLVGGALTLIYVIQNVTPEVDSWMDMVLPVTILRCMFGYVKVIHCLLIVHVYTELFFGLYCFLTFLSQTAFNCFGKTPHEILKKYPIVNTNDFNKTMKSVFGELWLLNFLFPMTIVLRQRGEGTVWDELK